MPAAASARRHPGRRGDPPRRGYPRGVADRRSLRALNRATLARQGLIERMTGPVAAVVGRLAGLQAQHANAPYVALWSRRDGQTIPDLEAALADRSVVKATLMRSTLHLVAADDYPALDAASAVARVANWRATTDRVGADPVALHAALLAFCVEPRSVAEMEAHLEVVAPGRFDGPGLTTGVRNTAFRVASAAGGLVHVPPSGSWRSHDRPRYIDARRWLEGAIWPDAHDATVTALVRYLGAYGPASLADVGKWLGQPRITVLRTAVTALGDRIVRYVGDDGRDLVDLAGLPVPDGETEAPARFLSRWDSVLIAYEGRDRILPVAHRAAVIKKNGDFLPTFLVDGFVAGLWSVAVSDGVASLRLAPFGRVPAAVRASLEAEGERLIRYVEAEATSHRVEWVA